MTEDELRSALAKEIEQAKQLADTKAIYRQKAMRYYRGEPFGNEIEGRSQVVSSDTSDKIEWIMPDLMKIFASGNQVVRFEPVGPEDEASAKQESDYVNHVFMNENIGYQILYQWFKAALLNRNAEVKFYWDEYDEVEFTTYTGLDDISFQMLLQDEDVEPTEHTEYPDQMQQSLLHDVKIKRTNKSGKAVVEPLPPEEFLIGARASSPDPTKATFSAHRSEKTKEELRQLGVSDKDIEELPKDGQLLFGIDRTARFREENTTFPTSGDGKYAVYECFYKVDYDGDGVCELKKILCDENVSKILTMEDTDQIPFASLTPVIMPFQYEGRAIPDQMFDIQMEKSVLKRNILDNLYLINNNRTEVVEGQVNMDDLLTSRPGGIVRTKAPGMMRPIEVIPFSGHAFSMLSYLDSEGENRTGVTKYNQGMDSDTLNKTATGITQIMSAAKQRVELIARTFAETGVKQLFLGLHGLIQKNQRKSRVVRMEGSWQNVDPSTWNVRKDMSVTVGLGTGNQDEIVGKLMQILNIQQQMLQGGLPVVTPQNIYNTANRLVASSGLKINDQYFTDPSTQEPKEPPPDPKMIAAQQKGQIDQQKNQAQIQMQQQKLQSEMQIAQMKLQSEIELKKAELQAEFQLKQMELNVETELRVQDMAATHTLDRASNLMDHAIQSRNMDGNMTNG